MDEQINGMVKTIQQLEKENKDLLAALVEARDVMQAFDMKSDKVNKTLDKINKLLNEETK